MARSAGGTASRGGPEEARTAIERFLQSSRQPVLQEPGEEPYALTQDRFHFELRQGRLLIEAWDERRNVSRRVAGVEEERPGRLRLLVERFGKRTGTITLLDQARSSNQIHTRHAGRLVFREQFRTCLAKSFPGWRIHELSSELDLHHSLSPNYPRALLVKGGAGIAAIGASEGGPDADRALGIGLIWLDHLRRRERHVTVGTLALFLPQGGQQTTCLRLHHLNPRAANYEVYLHDAGGFVERIDPSDHGNLETRLEACRCPSTDTQVRLNPLIERVRALPEVETVERGEGSMSLRVNGLEFACVTGGRLLFGIDRKQPAAQHNLPEVEALVAELSRVRSDQAADRCHPLFLRTPEAWLESRVRANIDKIDASLLSEPVYGQVPAVAGTERGVLDLLAVDWEGRLAVLELKASQDLQLPMQALDYWMRVACHAARGDFTRLGYFPGIALRAGSPRLLLVAPAIEFHSTTEALLRFYSPEIEVERVGVGIKWQRRLQVACRLRGAERPVDVAPTTE